MVEVEMTMENELNALSALVTQNAKNNQALFKLIEDFFDSLQILEKRTKKVDHGNTPSDESKGMKSAYSL